MTILRLLNDTIPALAWICKIQRGQPTLELEHGADVEIQQNSFFEGVWAGPFEKGAFLDNACFGTGAAQVEDGWVFTPPDHILDRLCFLQTDSELTISNSMALLLTRCGLDLDTMRADYPVLFGNVRHGLDNYLTDLPIRGGGAISLWAWHHMHVSPDLTVTKREKSRPVPMADYSQYVGYLSDQIRAVFDNGADPARIRPLTPLSTISSGYDSTMISALAADHGCREAITFSKTRAKLGKPAEDDSGAEASEILGLEVTVHDRLGFRAHEGLPEIETLGAGAEMSSARDSLKHSILLTGYMGDTMWDYAPKAVSTTIFWPVIAGHNFTELRLATGFAHFCVPFMGCRQQPEVIAISQSQEMAPWALHNGYDRPICRRVAEEHGIPRGAFGIKKRATGVFFREEGLQATMTPQSYADYTAFRKSHLKLPEWRVRATDKWIESARFLNSALGKATAVLNKVAKTKLKPPSLPAAPGITSEGALLFQWSIARLKERYRQKPPA